MKKQFRRNVLTALVILSLPASTVFARTAETNARPPRYEEPPGGGNNNDDERRRQQDEDRERERQAQQDQQRREQQERDRYDEQERERQRQEQDRRDEEERQRQQQERERQRQEQERRDAEERDRWERDHQSGGYTPDPVYTPDPEPIYTPDPEPIYTTPDPDYSYDPVPPQPDPVPVPVTPQPPKEYIFGCQQDVGVGCRLLQFWWQKPHYVAEVKFSEAVSSANVNTITLESVMNQGRAGQKGTLGITSIDIYLSNGQIFMKADSDKVSVHFPALPEGASIQRVKIKADSWIAPQTAAYLQMWFESQNDFGNPVRLVTP